MANSNLTGDDYLNKLAGVTDPVKKSASEKGSLSAIDYIDRAASRHAKAINTHKYESEDDAGLVLGVNQDYHRYVNQSGWDMTKAALANVVSEVTLGALEGAGYLLDAPQWIDILQGEEKEFGNWFSDTMKRAQEGIKEAMPVHQNPYEQDSFRPTDGTWWAEHAPSIASAVSLLLPSTLATKGLSYAAKLLGGKKVIGLLGKGDEVSSALKGITAASYSRFMENTMEATEVFNSTERKALDQGASEEEAKRIAGDAASKTWYANTANLAFDIPQYMLAFKSFSFMKKLATGAKVKNRALNVGTQAITEGGEEVGQFIVGKESEVSALSNANLKTGAAKYLPQRLFNYAADGELWTSFTMGALGGAAFSAVAALNSKKAEAARAINDQIHQSIAEKQAAVNEGNVKKFVKSEDIDLITHALHYIEKGEPEKIEEVIKAMEETDEETLASNAIDKKELGDKVQRARKIIKIAEKHFDTASKNPNTTTPELVRAEASMRVNGDLLKENKRETEKQIEELATKMQADRGLSNELTEIKRLKALRDAHRDHGNSERAEEIAEELNAIVNLVKETNPKLKTNSAIKEAIKHESDEELDKLTDSLLKEEAEIEGIQEQIEKFYTDEGVQEAQEVFDEHNNAAKERQLESVVSNITPNSTLEELEALREQARQLEREEDFNIALDQKIEERRLTSPKYHPNNLYTSLDRRYENNNLLKDKELKELGKILGTTIKDVEELGTLGAVPEHREKIDNYYDKINNRTDNYSSEDNEEVEEIVHTTRENAEPIKLTTPEDVEEERGKLSFVTMGEEFAFKKDNPTELDVDENNDVKPTEKDTFGIDHIWLNNGDNLPIGSKIRYEVDQNKKWNKTATSDDVIIELIHYIDGNVNNKSKDNRKVVGVLPAITNKKYANTEEKAALVELRQEVGKILKKSSTTGIVETNIETTVLEKFHGRFFNTSQNNKPHEVLREGDPLVFAIGTTKNGTKSLNVPSHGYSKRVSYTPANLTDGRVYQLVPTANGTIVPYRVFTSTLKEHPEKRAEVKRLLELLKEEPQNLKEISGQIKKIAYIDVIVDSQEGIKVKVGKNWIPINATNMDAYLDQKVVQVDAKSLNKGTYNKELSEQGIVYTDMMPKRYVHSTKVKVAPYKSSTVKTPPLKTKPKGNQKPTATQQPSIQQQATSKPVGTAVKIKKDDKSSWTLEVREDGSVYNLNTGNEVTDEKLINKAHLRGKYVGYKTVKDVNGQNYAITTDGRIINVTPNSKSNGNSILPTSSTGVKVREKAKQPVEESKEPVKKPVKEEKKDSAPVSEPTEETKDEPKNVTNEPEEGEDGPMPTSVPDFADEVVVTGFGGQKTAPKEPKDQNPTKTADFSKIKGVKGLGAIKPKPANEKSGSKFRRTSNNHPYKRFNAEEEVAWFKERFPNVPIEVLENLKNVHKHGGVNAWGVFHNAAVYLQSNAAVGTTYHEAMHVVLNMFLDENQANSLMRSAAVRYKYDPDNLSSADKTLIEEKLAEEYRTFVENNGSGYYSTSKPFSAQIRDFFKKIYQFFKAMFTDNITVDDLFYRLDTKFYKNKTPVYGRNSVFNNTTRFRLPNVDPQTKKSRITLLNSLFFEGIDQVREQNEDFKDKSDIDIINAIGDNVNEAIESLYGNVAKGIYEVAEESEPYLREELLDLLSNFVTEVSPEGEITGFGDYYYLAVRDLSRYGLKAVLKEDRVSDDAFDSAHDPAEGELSEEENTKEGWQIKHIETNGKDSLSYNVKKALRQTVEKVYDPETEEWINAEDDLGYKKYVDFDSLYNYLERMLPDIYDSNLMVERLKELARFKPDIYSLIDKLEANEQLKAQFFVNFAKTHAKFTYLQQVVQRYIDRSDGSKIELNTIKVFNSNRREIVNLTIDQWKANLSSPSRSSIIDVTRNIDLDAATKVKRRFVEGTENIHKTKKVTAHDFKFLTELLNEVGLEVTEEALQAQYQETTEYYAGKIITVPAINNYQALLENVSVILDSFAAGNNPVTEEFGETTSIKTFAKMIARNSYDAYQSSFRNVENKTVYSHISPNFLTQFIQELKNDENLDSYLASDYHSSNVWLNELKDNNEAREEFDYTIIDGFKEDGRTKGTKYTKMSDKQFETVNINMFHNRGSESYAWHKVPVLSDSPAMVFLKFKKYSNEEVLDGLYKVAVQETDRIAKVKRELKKGAIPIKNYHANTQYNFLDFLNGKEFDINNEEDVKELIRTEVEKMFSQEVTNLRNLEVIDQHFNSKETLDKGIKNREEFFQNYFYNSVFSNIQITQLTSGDLSYYGLKDGTTLGDFQKRNSQMWKPGLILDTNATKKGVSVRKNFNAIFLKDEEFVSSQIDSIEEALDTTGLSDQKKKEILAAYSSVNQTDGQGLITLDRYREIMIGLGRWTDELVEAYPALKAGRATPHELQLVLGTLKPFYFGHVGKDKKPLQLKNSEMVLLPQLAKKSDELTRLLDYMEKNEVDTVQFESAVKVGLEGEVSFAGLQAGVETPIIHTLENKNYRLQQEVPQHFVDTTNKFGSQLRKLIIADLDANATFLGLSKDETVKLYQELISQNVIDAYNEVYDTFVSETGEDNIEAVQKMLLEEVRDRGLGEQFEDALKIVESSEGKKRFNLPLFDPLHARRIESLLNSVFKNRIANQKINGGSFVLNSNFGFSDRLKLVFNEETKAIEHMEVMLPWWTKKFFPTDINGEVDFDQIPEDLLEGMGYRIPTEHKYSMAKIKVVGFTPQNSGGLAILPAEITAISGSDFDIDKMYVMFPNFEMVEENIKLSNGKILTKSVPKKVDYGELTSLVKKEDSEESPVAGLTKEQRDNALLDIMTAIWSHPSNTAQVLEPGNFELLKKYAQDMRVKTGSNTVSVVTPAAQRQIFRDNMIGSDLVSIFANHNSSHAMVQHGELKSVVPIKFDGKSLNTFNKQYNEDGTLISRELASLLAAAVDNGKDPIAGDLNINQYTSDTLATLLRVGYPIHTALAFLNQPIMRTFVQRYYNRGATRSAEKKLFEEFERKLLTQIGDNNVKHKKSYTFKTKQLWSDINTQANEEKSKAYYLRQLDVLRAWKRYQPTVTGLSKITKAMKADTLGTQKTMATNEEYIDSIKSAIDLDSFENVRDYFSENGPYPLLHSFTKFALIEPNNILARHFPYMENGFKTAKDRLAYIKGDVLTAEEIDYINSQMLEYAISSFEFFDHNEKKKLVDKLPDKLLKYKEKHPDNEFLKRLILSKAENGQEFVAFVNNGSLTNEVAEQVTEGWEYLLTQDGETAEFAKALIKYSYFTAGFNINPNSFGRFIPVSFFSSLQDSNGVSLSDHMYKILDESKSSDVYSSFVDQFVRNHADKGQYLTAAFFHAQHGNVSTGKMMTKERVTTSLEVRGKEVGSKVFVRNIDEEGRYSFAPYLKKLNYPDPKNKEGRMDVYRLVGYGDSDGTVGIYHIVEKLGVNNFMTEYDRNTIEPESVIASNALPENIPEDKYHKVTGDPFAGNVATAASTMFQFAHDGNSVAVENQFNLRNEDGSRKRYINWSKARGITIDVNKKLYNTGLTAKLIRVAGEKGDTRVYNAVQIVPTGSFQLEGEKSTPDIALNETLISFLSAFGIDVETYSNLKQRLGVDAAGMADFTKKLILISQDKEKRDTLPEEAGHFAVEMLKDDALVARMRQLIRETPEWQEVSNDPRYVEQYDNDQSKLELEAIGKLLGRTIIKNHERSNSLPARITRVLTKLWNKFTSLFKRGNTADLQEQIENVFGGVADAILNRRLDQFDINKLNDQSPAFQLAEDTDQEEARAAHAADSVFSKQEKALKDAIETVYKKLIIYKERGRGSFTRREEELESELRKLYNDQSFELGLVRFAEEVHAELPQIAARFERIKKRKEDTSALELVKELRAINNYASAYEIPIIETRRALEEVGASPETLTGLSQMSSQLKDIKDTYLDMSRDLMAEILRPFASGDRDGEGALDIKAALLLLDKDISWGERWLDSVAEGGDDIAKITDRMVKEHKEKARLRSLSTFKKMVAAKMKLEKAGIPTANYVYERDYNGKLTGNLLSEFNQGQWEQDRIEFFAKLRSKYKLLDSQTKPAVGTRERKEWNREVKEWFQENTQTHPDKERILEEKEKQFIREYGPERGTELMNEWVNENSGIDITGERYYKRELAAPSDKYTNEVWKEMQKEKGAALKEFYDLVWEVKKNSDKLIPEKYRNKFLAPQIRKDIIERWKSKEGIVNATKETGKEFLDSMIRREDDTAFGLTDESKRPVNFLPVFFTRKLSDPEEMSTDIVSTMSTFNFMAEDFNQMNKIVDALEVTRDILRERKIGTGRFDPVSAYKERKLLTEDGAGSAAFKRFEDYMKMVVYGQIKKDEGELLGTQIDQAKAIDAFGTYVAIQGLAGNVYAGLANPILGNWLTRQEAIAGEFFGHADLLFADTTYTAELPKVLAEVGSRNKTSKMELWLERANTLQDYNQRVRGIDSERKTWFSKMFKMSSLFALSHAGEHQIQARSSLALASTIKLKDNEGKEYNLYQAFDVSGNELKLKPNLRIVPDGKTFKEEDRDRVFTESDFIKFVNKQNFINQRLHGIYNDIDKAAAQQLALGRLALMFRKFLKPGINRRFEKLTYNYTGEVWTEGYYKTTAVFLTQIAKDIQHTKSIWKQLKPNQKANVLRSLSELVYVIGVSTLATILTNLSDDDEENDALAMTAYQMNRLRTELTFYLNPAETLRILKSPAAAVNQMDKIVDLLVFWDWADEIERGRYEGFYKGERALLDMVPLAPTILKATEPREQLQFFQ